MQWVTGHRSHGIGFNLKDDVSVGEDGGTMWPVWVIRKCKDLI